MPDNIPQLRLTVYLIKEVGLLFIIHFIFMESKHVIDAMHVQHLYHYLPNVLASVAVCFKYVLNV